MRLLFVENIKTYLDGSETAPGKSQKTSSVF